MYQLIIYIYIVQKWLLFSIFQGDIAHFRVQSFEYTEHMSAYMYPETKSWHCIARDTVFAGCSEFRFIGYMSSVKIHKQRWEHISISDLPLKKWRHFVDLNTPA